MARFIGAKTEEGLRPSHPQPGGSALACCGRSPGSGAQAPLIPRAREEGPEEGQGRGCRHPSTGTRSLRALLSLCAPSGPLWVLCFHRRGCRAQARTRLRREHSQGLCYALITPPWVWEGGPFKLTNLLPNSLRACAGSFSSQYFPWIFWGFALLSYGILYPDSPRLHSIPLRLPFPSGCTGRRVLLHPLASAAHAPSEGLFPAGPPSPQ